MKKLIILFAILIAGFVIAKARVISVEPPQDKPSTAKPVVKKHTTPLKKAAVTTEQSGKGLDIPMVYVQGGSFNMGGNLAGDDAKPIHKVTLNSFYIGKYELTVDEFRKFINATHYKTSAEQEGWSYKQTGGKPQRRKGATWEYDSYGVKRLPTQDMLPVVNVSWDDAVQYCQWLSSQTGRVYRLPMEAEWEYAARGGNKSENYMYSGSHYLARVGWYVDNSNKQIHQGGQKDANELGIFDMSGNVFELCHDWYGKTYYASSPAENPTGPQTGTYRMIRGGSWDVTAQPCLVVYRGYCGPVSRFNNLGFRLVLVP